MAYHPDAIREKTRLGGYVLYSFVGAVIAALAIGTYGEPFLAQQLGSGVPWWVYPLLFIPFVIAVARVIMEDAATHHAKRAARARHSRKSKDFEDSGWRGQSAPSSQFDFGASEIH